MRLVFYISGHGYGHAVRDIEIVKSLQKINKVEIHFRTKAPRWLFEPFLNERFVYHDRELDFGVFQKNSFYVDKKMTFERYADLIAGKEKLVAEEVAFLKRVEPDIILSDITPFAFDAADIFGKKAIAIGNFSWDWIYSAYLDEFPEYEWIVRDIRSSYAKAERLWRIPFYGDMTAFPNPQDVPLIGRKATKPAEHVRKELGLSNDGTKSVLLGLRVTDLMDVNWQRVEKIPGLTFIAVSRDVPLKNYLHVREGRLPFENVLNACDAVISKPGYSMVSEVITNQTPLVYVPRKDFAEEPVLIDGLNEFAVSEVLSQENFYAGNWQESFERLFAGKKSWNHIRIDGGDVIARKIYEYA